ncbi:hypothetical protein N0V88_001648 [Collariella sp. IMI 366227]|nr:hypothetical protein N0V88_001648 [Collariella sp. IMI 366227]
MEGHKTWKDAVEMSKMPYIGSPFDIMAIVFIESKHTGFLKCMMQILQSVKIEFLLDFEPRNDDQRPDFWKGAELTDHLWRCTYMEDRNFKRTLPFSDDLTDLVLSVVCHKRNLEDNVIGCHAHDPEDKVAAGRKDNLKDNPKGKVKLEMRDGETNGKWEDKVQSVKSTVDLQLATACNKLEADTVKLREDAEHLTTQQKGLQEQHINASEKHDELVRATRTLEEEKNALEDKNEHLIIQNANLINRVQAPEAITTQTAARCSALEDEIKLMRSQLIRFPLVPDMPTFDNPLDSPSPIPALTFLPPMPPPPPIFPNTRHPGPHTDTGTFHPVRRKQRSHPSPIIPITTSATPPIALETVTSIEALTTTAPPTPIEPPPTPHPPPPNNSLPPSTPHSNPSSWLPVSHRS